MLFSEFFLSPGAGRQLFGLGLLVCGVGLILTHLVIAGRRIEKLNEVLPPEEQFDPAYMRRDMWRFERVFRARFPRDWSLQLELACLFGGGIVEVIGLSSLIPHFFR
jgi:hypothetical protein